MQIAISVLLATLVAALGYLLISRNYFYDFWLFVICFVIAKCQFSLLKVNYGVNITIKIKIINFTYLTV